MCSNVIPYFRDITVDFVLILSPSTCRRICPDSCTWLAQANSQIAGLVAQSERSQNESCAYIDIDSSLYMDIADMDSLYMKLLRI